MHAVILAGGNSSGVAGKCMGRLSQHAVKARVGMNCRERK
jgi:hypothetical protein